MFEYDHGHFRAIYSSDMPQEVLDAVQPLVQKWGWLVPRLCDQIRVKWSIAPDEGDDGDEILGASEVSSEYRVGTIHLYPAWLAEQPISRERVFVHELCHIVIAPLAELADFIVARCAEDPILRAFVEEWNRKVLEGVTTDLEQVILRSPTKHTAIYPYDQTL
jgi:hypothetical protein